jgi:hypothetical protein
MKETGQTFSSPNPRHFAKRLYIYVFVLQKSHGLRKYAITNMMVIPIGGVCLFTENLSVKKISLFLIIKLK